MMSSWEIDRQVWDRVRCLRQVFMFFRLLDSVRSPIQGRWVGWSLRLPHARFVCHLASFVPFLRPVHPILFPFHVLAPMSSRFGTRHGSMSPTPPPPDPSLFVSCFAVSWTLDPSLPSPPHHMGAGETGTNRPGSGVHIGASRRKGMGKRNGSCRSPRGMGMHDRRCVSTDAMDRFHRGWEARNPST
eukprot:scaffold308_cov327-Pavlova_lutheri.AAC.22